MATQTVNEITSKVQESLQDGPFACSKLEKLTGGTANFVYRGTLKTKLKDGSETVVVKHTEGFSASNFNFKLTDKRCDYERTILKALNPLEAFPPLTYDGILIQTPQLHHFDVETNTQIYTDLPSSLDLKTCVLTHSETLTQPQCQAFGYALGAWLKSFHQWANSDETQALRKYMKGNKEMRDLKYTINYTVLVNTIERYPAILDGSRILFEDVARSVNKELDELDGGGMLIHGDFWSGNILLPSGPITNSPDKPVEVFVIDWELSQLSLLEFDLGQMIAELYKLKHFKNHDAGIWLLESFIKGYGDMSEDMKWKVIVQAGAHLVCWGSRVAGWGSEEQVEDVVKTGRDWIVNGWERNKEFFKNMVLGGLFSEDRT